MIGHEAIGRDANLGLSVGLSENFLKRGVVRRLLEQFESADAPIQDMIGEVPSSKARPAWHGGACIETSILLSRKDSRPLFLAPDPFSLLYCGEGGGEGRRGEERAGPRREIIFSGVAGR